MSSRDALNIVLAAFISMSAVELLKELTPLRYVFNRWAVQRWLWRGLDLQLDSKSQLWTIIRGKWLEPKSICRPSRPPSQNAQSQTDNTQPSADTAPTSAETAQPSGANAEWQTDEPSSDNVEASVDTIQRYEGLEKRVVELAACGQRAALYRPEVAQIAGQLHLLAERLMDFPSQDPIVLRAIAGVPEVRLKGSSTQPDEDLKRLAGLTDGFRAALAHAEVSASQTTSAENAPSTPAKAGELIDTRSRVTGWVQGRLNELQITGRTSWRVLLLALAIVIGVAVVVVPGHGRFLDGVFAGLLAPITYELLSMIKRIGRP